LKCTEYTPYEKGTLQKGLFFGEIWVQAKIKRPFSSLFLIIPKIKNPAISRFFMNG